jgi:DNA-binding PadR family transcriptional regulator
MLPIEGPRHVFRMNAMYVLWRISRKPDYCYAMAKEADAHIGKPGPCHTSVVRTYLVLQYLAKRGWAKGTREQVENRARVVYSATAKGREELERFREEIRPALGEYLEFLGGKG